MNKKSDNSKKDRKHYHKPQLTRIRLVIEEARWETCKPAPDCVSHGPITRNPRS